jgi:hypothetical protein
MYQNNYGMFPYQGYYGSNDFRNVQNTCQKFMNYHVIGQMSDGSQVEGIIEDMDDDGVTMLVPEMVEEDAEDTRIYGGFGGFGGGYGPRRRFRRYRRQRYPYNVFVFPFFFPFPFYF